MNGTLKAIVRAFAGLAAIQGPLVADLTSVSVPAKWVSGIVAAIGLGGLLAEVALDTANGATPATPTKPPAA